MTDIWTDANLDKIVAWCEQAYPKEGCGLVVETGDDGETADTRVIETENLADKYHEMDPEAFPRTAREFYMIDPREFMKVEERGEELAVVFHSHADVGDYFSDEDVRAATMPREDGDDGEEEPLEPSYPGVDYLVVSVRDGRADHATLFRFDEEGADRAETAFEAVLEIAIDDGDYAITAPRS